MDWMISFASISCYNAFRVPFYQAANALILSLPCELNGLVY